jgi:hypothetical protein
MFGWGTLTGWTNATSPQLRRNKTETSLSHQMEFNESGSGLNESEFGGFGMDDEGSSWVGSSMAFGAILGSMLAGKTVDDIKLLSFLFKIHVFRIKSNIK